MRKHTNRALLLSLSIHVVLMFIVPMFLVNRLDVEKESISAEILEVDLEKWVRREVLSRRTRLGPRMANAEVSDASPTLPTYARRVSLPKALVYADVVPDVVTDIDIPQKDELSPVSNISIGEDKTERTLKRRTPRILDGYAQHKIGGTETTLNGVDTELGIFDMAVMPGHGLIGEVFVRSSAISQMPNFDRLAPVYTFVTPNLNVPIRNYTEGFPTPEIQFVIENFAIRFRAELKIDTPGLYTFGLKSDDGSQLYINGKLVVDNDGIHSAIHRQVSIKLSTGIYPVEIHYFQGPRHAIALQWFYKPPNSGRQIVPPEVIYLPDKP